MAIKKLIIKVKIIFIINSKKSNKHIFYFRIYYNYNFKEIIKQIMVNKI